MSVTPSAIVQAAVEAAVAELRKHGLEKDIPKLSQYFMEELRAHAQVLQVVITTPTGNAGEFKETISALLTKKLARPVHVEERADASMIGGIILSFGDERIDLSVRGALQQLEQELQTTRSATHKK